MTPCQALLAVSVCAIGVALSPLAIAWDVAAWLIHRTSRLLLVVGLLVPLVGCAHHRAKPPAPPDWTPPVWVVEVQYDGISPGYCPTSEQFTAEYDRVTRCWLDYWRSQPGAYARRPPSMPDPGAVVHATVTCKRSCTQSADTLGDGYDIIVKAWSCTLDQPEPEAFMLSAAGHGLSHRLSGITGGNAAHEIFSRTCGV